VNPEIGRFFEGRLLGTIKLLQVLYDLGLGAGYDTCAWVDGKELVIGRGDPFASRGFMRVIPEEAAAWLCFPRGARLFDPQKRAKGPPGSQTRIYIRSPQDVDAYVRRMIDEAYAIEE
jgi:hypothetical protein